MKGADYCAVMIGLFVGAILLMHGIGKYQSVPIKDEPSQEYDQELWRRNEAACIRKREETGNPNAPCAAG